MRKRRGVSAGTIVMLVITVGVLAGFFALMPTLTGNHDIRVDAVKLAVAMDSSFSQLDLGAFAVPSAPRATILPPQSLATAVPAVNATYAPTAPPTVVATPVPKLSFTFCAAGSVVWNTQVQRALTLDDEYRFDILTDSMTGRASADLSVVTLEHTLLSDEKISNTNMPAQILSPLRQAGFTAVSLGHDDALNGGVSGLSETMRHVSEAGMIPYGLYADAAARSQCTMVNANGVQVALLAYQNEISSTGRKQTTEAERGFAFAPVSMEVIASDIARARQSGAQVVLVSLHWGKAGASTPTDEQLSLAQEMANAGADIIIGTRSGALQPVQVLSAERGDGRYHPVLCAYSLGNLFSYDREKRANLASILLNATVVYDPVTGCVAFDDLTYTPTYAWRGKDGGKTLQRILINDNVNYPDFVDKDQKGVMQRCFKLVSDVMESTMIPMCTPNERQQ